MKRDKPIPDYDDGVPPVAEATPAAVTSAEPIDDEAEPDRVAGRPGGRAGAGRGRR